LEEVKLKTTNEESKVIKFFSPLQIQTYEDCENEPTDISPYEAVCYADEIMSAIDHSKLPSEIDKGLMAYFDESKTVSEKVNYAYPKVEEYNGELFGVMVAHVKGELTKSELDILTSHFSGQFSDGWGEGFEQHPIKTHDGDIYVSFWQSGNDYFIKSEEEFIAEHKQDYEMKM
jgi:hypothetical protein